MVVIGGYFKNKKEGDIKMIKCTARDCENNDNNTCCLNKINIDFNYDPESYGAFCSNFSESDDSRKRTYRLNRIKDKLYFVVRTEVLNDADIEMIRKDINECNSLVIVDNLIYYNSSHASNRFWIYSTEENDDMDFFRVSDKSNLSEVLNDYNVEVKDLLKITCDYIREQEKYVSGVLHSVAYKMIMKGIDL